VLFRSDAPGGSSAGGHSSVALAQAALAGGAASGLPVGKLTLGLPFYGRHSATGDWTTYEDIVQQHAPLAASSDTVPASQPGSAIIHFNGVDTIMRKTRLALAAGWGGVMVWEAGQDCRLAPVTRDSRTHARTCPGAAGAANASLLVAIARALPAPHAGGGRGRRWLRALGDGSEDARQREEL
jgi:GH18 family chitinase